MLMKLVSIVSDILNEQMASALASSKNIKPKTNTNNTDKGPIKNTNQEPIRYSNQALDLIKKFETFQNKTYLCNAGKQTIGYGTRLDFHPEIKKDVCITEPKASELLKKDLDTLVTPVIKNNVKVKLKQNQIDAVYSLVHNIGMENFVTSNVLKLLNMGKFTKMKNEWVQFQMSDGKVLKGLTRRRLEELDLFFS
jgi:lysozyme